MKAFKKEIKVTLHVFIGEILANMTQVSDVAPGPLVCLKMDKFKFSIFADIPAYFIVHVIKIHVRIKRICFFSLKS
jgi:hypothetical protein